MNDKKPPPTSSETVVIANPRAAAGRTTRIWKRFASALADRYGEPRVVWTARPGDATAQAREATASGCERIVVIGGDGTLSEAVNGLTDRETGELHTRAPRFVYLPAGTGTDFARTVGTRGLPPAEILDRCTPRTIDLGRMTLGRPDAPIFRHFVNIASAGASGLIVQMVNAAPKRFGGRISFALGTLRGLAAWRHARVSISLDTAAAEEVLLNTVVVANGRFFGGGMQVAPTARIDDGLLDVVVIGRTGPLRFVTQGHRIYKGTHLGLPGIRHKRCRRVEIRPADDRASVPLEADGEHVGMLPAVIEARPAALTLETPWEETP